MHIQTLLIILPCLLISEPAQAWEHYGNNAGGTKYSELNQINADNVSQLTRAWTYHTGETGEGFPSALTFEATPVLWHDTLYLNSSYGKAYAIDAATGKEVWRYDAGFKPNEPFDETAARGVTLWHDPDPASEACTHRVFLGTLKGNLHAIDALTGTLCKDFADQGILDLTEGVGDVQAGSYTLTSPPAVIGATLFVGSAIGDNRKVASERGIVRAVDARTGAIVWTWDPIPRDPNDPARISWANDSADSSGGANAWAPLSADPEANLVYVPTSSPSPDFFAGHRAGNNHYANSVVALDAASGRVVWHQQLVHHDVWDYDTPAQPVLVDLDLGDGTVPAVVQSTKTGMLYVFNRLTGEPLIPVEERPVPQNGAPGEQLAPTQPFSTLPALLKHEPLTEDDAFGLLWFDQRACRNRIQNSRNEGIFTPPSLEGTIMRPGYAGGINWGGVAIHPERGIAVAFVNDLPTIVRLVPRDGFDPNNRPEPDMGYSQMRGTPYIMQRDPFLSPLGLPCTQPPWGKLVALDLRSREILWDIPLGTIADLAPSFVPDFAWGVPGMGGALVTASDLVFIGAAAEKKFRAFDLLEGRALWEASIPFAGNASPMTYQVGNDQFVVIAAGGHGHLAHTVGDAVVAFKLP
ncbi:MAG: pyrroloquinoline quinone-dependent dehydrogenase [Pseudomonadota bacterium]